MEHIMEQKLNALKLAKIYHSFTIDFYKSKRKNAKHLKQLNLFIDNVDILSLTNIFDSYIMLYRQYKDLHVTIRINKYYKINHTVLKNIRMTTYNNICFYSFECFINAVIDSLILLNPNNINTLGSVHDSVIVKQYIRKYYNH